MLQEIIRAKRIDIHVPAHANELRPAQVVERKFILEQLGDLDDILWRSGFARRAHFTEEFLEFLGIDDALGLEPGFRDGLLQELGHFDAHAEETTLFLVLGRVSGSKTRTRTRRAKGTHGGELAFECRGQHVGEELQRDGQEDLHERHDDKDAKRNEPQQIRRRSSKLLGKAKRQPNIRYAEFPTRLTCRLSLRVNCPPFNTFHVILLLILISLPSNFVPAQ